MNRQKLLSCLESMSSAAGIPHSGEYRVQAGCVQVVLHHKLPDAARRKMRRRWAEMKAANPELPPIRIRAHRLAMNTVTQ